MSIYWQEHPGAGPYLLLVHGFLTSGRQWLHNLECLGKVCRPITVDLFGHGQSPCPTDRASYLPTNYIAEFEQIRTELGVEDWFVCGYSLGASLTIRYALTHPERVVGHAFTNSNSALADAAQQAASQKSAEENIARIHNQGMAAIEKIPVHPKFARRLPADLYQALLEDSQILDPIGVAYSIGVTNSNASVRELLNTNQSPALLVCGSREKRFADHRQFVAQHMTRVEIVDIEAGHGVNMEDSIAFNAALTNFVKQHISS